jgi:hypothetical protein
MRLTTGRSLLAAAIFLGLAWCAAFAVRPVAEALGASMSHTPPFPVALLIYVFFGAHLLAFGAVIVAAVLGLVGFARDPAARTFRSISLVAVALVSLPPLAVFIWLGILHRY